MATITCEWNFPAQQTGVYLTRECQSSMPSQPVPIPYGPGSVQPRGFQDSDNSSQGRASFEQPYVSITSTNSAQRTPPKAMSELSKVKPMTKGKRSNTFFGTVGKTIDEVVGRGRSTVSSICNVWGDYFDSTNQEWLDRKKEEADQEHTIANIKSTLERGTEAQVAQTTAASVQVISTGVDSSARNTMGSADIDGGKSANPGDPRTSCAERLASGKRRWDPSRDKFVSILRSIDTDKESDFQEPLEETFVLHGCLHRWNSHGKYEPDHLLWDPENDRYLLVTAEIASLLTHPIYGFEAVNDTSEDGSQQWLQPDQAASPACQFSMPHPPQGVPMMTPSLPVSQGSSAYIQPNPRVWAPAPIRSEHPPPTCQWPNLSAQTPPSSHSVYVGRRLWGGSVAGSCSAEPAPRMTSSEFSDNKVNVTPPARAHPPVRHYRSLFA
jgi:hypothetical protein